MGIDIMQVRLFFYSYACLLSNVKFNEMSPAISIEMSGKTPMSFLDFVGVLSVLSGLPCVLYS